MVRDEVVLTPTHPKQAVAYEPPMTAHVHHDEPVHGGAFIPPQPERAVLRPARMPRVDELPVPAQNQIRASRGEEAGQDHKRMTLLQRLATVGFGRKDEAPAPVHAPLEPPPQVSPSEPRGTPSSRVARPCGVRSRNGRSAGLHRPAQGQLDPQGRMPHQPRHVEDDQLEIPAFLRRAN